MKSFKFLLFLLIANLFISHELLAQVNVVIVPCKPGTLIIDGTPIKQVEEDDAVRQTLSFGEHYLQLKGISEKINLTVKIDKDFKEVIKLGCATQMQSIIHLINKEVDLAGAFSSSTDQNLITLDQDDTLSLSCSILNKKGDATISITDYTSGRVIYQKMNFNKIDNEKISIPGKGIYNVNLYTDALFGKTAKLVIDRIPSPKSNSNFKTQAKQIYDTTAVEVLHTYIRVYSTTNLDHINRTAIKINLPQNTSYWTYWIGVDQEAQQKMKDFINDITKVGKYFTTNPLTLFGLKLIPSLPMMNAPATINYQFMDSKNSQAFLNRNPYRYFNFKYGTNITTDYSLVNVKAPDLVLGFSNESTMNGRNVEVRVVAFIIKAKIVMDE